MDDKIIMMDNYSQRMKEQTAAKNVKIAGVGADAEIVTNSAGGKQSKSPMAMHLVDPKFLNAWFNTTIPDYPMQDFVIRNITSFMIYEDYNDLLQAIFELHTKLHGDGSEENLAIVEIAKVLQYGASRYRANNWRLIPQEEHINHALIHYMAYLLGDEQDNHIEHCMCRLMMAYATEKSEGFSYTKYKPSPSEQVHG